MYNFIIIGALMCDEILNCIWYAAIWKRLRKAGLDCRMCNLQIQKYMKQFALYCLVYESF